MQPEQICVIGDKLTRDIALAHKIGCLAVKVDPFTESKYSLKLWLGTKIEIALWRLVGWKYSKQSSFTFNNCAYLKSEFIND